MGKLFGSLADMAQKAEAAAQKAASDTKDKAAEAAKAVTEKSEEFAKYFSESGLMDKMKEYGNKLGSAVLYPIVLLYSALASDKTPTKAKMVITGALGYFILPADLIPDFVPGMGFSDDIAAIMAALAAIKTILTPEVFQDTAERIKKMFDKVDEETLQKLTSTALDTAEDILKK